MLGGNIRSQLHTSHSGRGSRISSSFSQADMAPKLYFTLQSPSTPVRLLFLLCRLNFELTWKITEAPFFCKHTVAIAAANIIDLHCYYLAGHKLKRGKFRKWKKSKSTTCVKLSCVQFEHIHMSIRRSWLHTALLSMFFLFNWFRVVIETDYRHRPIFLPAANVFNPNVAVNTHHIGQYWRWRVHALHSGKTTLWCE